MAKSLGKQKKEIRDRYERKGKRIDHITVSGLIIGAGLILGPIGKGIYDSSSYDRDPDVAQYQDMRSTLNTLRIERNRTIPNLSYQSESIKSNMDEVQLEYSKSRNSLDKAIETVKTEMIDLGSERPNVREYEHWSETGFIKPVLVGLFGMGVLFTSFLYSFISGNRNLGKKINELGRLEREIVN